MVDNLAGIPDLETIYVVTNDKFAADFQAWSERYRSRHPEFKFKIINDGSTSDEDKLGAIGDINFVVSRENLSQSSLLIVAGDNLFTKSLANFVECARGTDATVAVYDVGAVLSLLTTYLAAGNNPDQPGRFVQWLYTRKPINTFQIKGKWLDIGSKETLENADAILAKIKM
ncbi:MAG: hypothetical protein DME95_09790 [Verrucomicrobia bacterium]|nr:MAG: hypothetical protein DME95_09790 [Verrucomicrobiota bacterium]